jgi:hypothetical protein
VHLAIRSFASPKPAAVALADEIGRFKLRARSRRRASTPDMRGRPIEFQQVEGLHGQYRVGSTAVPYMIDGIARLAE